MCNSDEQKPSEREQVGMIARVCTTVQVQGQECEGEVLKIQMRYEVQGRDLRLQQDSDTRSEVLLVFLVCTGEYTYNVKF